MGWFLSRSSGKKRNRRARRPASGASVRWDPGRTLAGVKLLAVVGVAAAAVFGWQWSERELRDYASRTRSVRPVVLLEQKPAWLSESTADQIRQAAAKLVGDDPMSRDGLTAAANALKQNPWVERVHQVRRSTGGRVIVEAEYRRPVALIRTGEGYYVVDAEGVWLPTDDRSHLRLPMITGVRSAAPRRFGEAWASEDASAALALVRTLEAEPYMDQVVSIDASGRDAMGRVQLVLYSDESWAIWGLAPGDEKMVEPEASVKLARLRRVVSRSGTIDADGRGVYLNGATIMTARAER